jgi:hypothetical protein
VERRFSPFTNRWPGRGLLIQRPPAGTGLLSQRSTKDVCGNGKDYNPDLEDEIDSASQLVQSAASSELIAWVAPNVIRVPSSDAAVLIGAGPANS